MEKRIMRSMLLLALLLPAVGCKEPYLAVAEANGNVRRGLYQQALAVYLPASGESRFPERIEYNIGNVYYYLGETERALASWNSSLSGGEKETAYRAHFNAGVVRFKRKEFSQAAEAFLQALRLFPERMEAKINLEHSVRQMNTKAGGRAESGEDSEQSDIEVMMSIIRNSEKIRWEKQEGSDTVEASAKDW